MNYTDASSPSLLQRRSALGPAYRLFYEQPFHPVRGEGVWLFDEQGRRFLDAYNNVPVVGHANPAVVQALTQQASVLNTHTRYLHDNVVTYAERLLALFPQALDTAMFTCTGSEANDLALRIAYEVTGHRGVIVTRNAYHGVTQALADMSPSLRPAAAHVAVIDPPSFQGLDATTSATQFAARIEDAARTLSQKGTPPAVLMLDTVFASDGIHIDPAPILSAAQAAIHRHGGLLVADEVQGGFGRTGRWWAFQRESVVPDMVSMGKPMGNGHPIAALVMKSELMALFGQRCRYFNTFGGNSVSAAVGLAVLEELERMDALNHVRTTGQYLGDALRQWAQSNPMVRAVRGDGLYWGVEMSSSQAATGVMNYLREHGVLISSSGPLNDTLKIRPPLPFTTENADLLTHTLHQACTHLA